MTNIESLYSQGDTCLNNLMQANYFKSAEYILNHLSQNEKLSRSLYHMSRAGVITGIEKINQGQNDLIQFLDKYISKEPLVVISPAFRWA